MSSVHLSQPLAVPFPLPFPGWARVFNRRLTKPPTHPLRPVIPDNAWGTRITAAAGTSLATPYSSGTIKNFLPDKRCLRPEGLHPPRDVAPSGFRPLRKILGCCHP